MKKPSPLLLYAFLMFVAMSMISMREQTAFAQQPQAQRPRPPVDPAANPRFRAMSEAISQRSRELGLISVSDDEDQAEFVRRRQNQQLSEDFAKLYSINVETIVKQSSASALDYKVLSAATLDLKNRASRIKNNVPLLQVADKGERIRYEENPESLPSMLPELTRLIDSFLGSPIFRLSSPDDGALRLKASRDLESIIRLSDTISKVTRRSTRTASSQ